MRAPNFFAVDAATIDLIERWLDNRKSLSPDELTSDTPPAALGCKFRPCAQAALAQLCSEQPHLVLSGSLAMLTIPVLLLLGVLLR